ncbi:hypothetical protein G3O08_08205 [Cryomorpha ignava]|uniref:Uncharacterized protein n=1 Tax=Cryomorpha ignava TaxID=101383 RepID=A0A7K3WRL8_9FLAO|nr:hypothetical protein [Cryomorpha ignava]NEN23482.1 hypothetical protein [Cryomorpha ignava]
MNHLKSLFGALLFVFTTLAVEAQTETQPVYYRYFSVEVQDLNQSEFNQFAAARTANTSLKFEEYCSTTSSLLISFDAAQPKRIEEMKSEITSELQSAFPTKTISTISTVSYSNHSNFCE